MALKIEENNGTFLVEGIINSLTIEKFKNQLEILLTFNTSVIINIDKVTAIDKQGLKVIESFFAKAKLNNKTFTVIGYGCKDIYESMDAIAI